MMLRGISAQTVMDGEASGGVVRNSARRRAASREAETCSVRLRRLPRSTSGGREELVRSVRARPALRKGRARTLELASRL
jgi:hypothetical protein